jgi:hypothetical protein
VAAHEIGSGSGRILSAVVAPLNKQKEVKTNWGSPGKIFNELLKHKDKMYYCVPLDDGGHLQLEDNNIQ